MRIAFLAGHLSRRASGVRQMIEGLSGGLAALGAETKVFGINDAAWETGDQDTWQGAPAQTFDRQGPKAFGYMPGLKPALDAFAPDVVHLHGLWMYSSLVAANWAEGKGRCLVISPHGMLAPAALTYSPTRKRIVRKAFQDRCFRNAAGFVATANQEASDIRNALGDKTVATIPLGVKVPQINLPAWEDRTNRVVAIGRLHPVKGYAPLLHAWAKIPNGTDGWKLDIAGPDPDGYGDTLRQLIGKLGLRNATIGSPVYGAERDALIADSKIFVLPSETENFALTVPEALLCETPVMASKATPWQDLITHSCGWWVDPRPEVLATTLHSAMSETDRVLAEMGRSGRAWSEQAFSWDHIASDTMTYYKSLLERVAP